MKWLKILCIILLLGCTDSESKEPKVFNLPNAVFNKPYLTQIKFSKHSNAKSDFVVLITPQNSGLTVVPTNEWYYEIKISGIPKTKQDIYINIDYTERGPRKWGESLRKSKRFKIEVKEINSISEKENSK